MSSNHGTRRVQRKKSEQEPNLSDQYGKIGIKAVAAAAHDKAKESGGGASGDQEQKKHAKEKPSG